jgi:hypothetical protein
MGHSAPEGAITALTVFLSHLDAGGAVLETEHMDPVLCDTTMQSVVAIAGLILYRLGEPARDALADLAIEVAVLRGIEDADHWLAEGEEN